MTVYFAEIHTYIDGFCVLQFGRKKTILIMNIKFIVRRRDDEIDK
jgi:hypothetical protein